MSWFFKSLQASDEDDDDNSTAELQSNSSSECVGITAANPSVKDDFSALGEALSRQLRGVANFLAPQSPPAVAVVSAVDSSDSSSYYSPLASSRALQGIRNDLAEIGGSLRAGFLMREISRFASNLLPFQNHSSDDEDEDEEDEEFEDESGDATPGITDEVLNFVTDISSRPEYWTDFPLELDDTDFEMSEVQRIHISTIEQLIPNISALRIKLQGSMSNELFWMIYFTILLPRFNEHDFELLSSPEIIEARDILLEILQRKERAQVNSDNICANNLVSDTKEGNMPSGEKTISTQIIKGSEGLEIKGGDGGKTNQRLEKADSETSRDGKERFEYISFSDMENDGSDFSGRFSVTKSPAESGGWVKLHGNLESKPVQDKTWKQDRDSEDGESSDWFNVDEFD